MTLVRYGPSLRVGRLGIIGRLARIMSETDSNVRHVDFELAMAAGVGGKPADVH